MLYWDIILLALIFAILLTSLLDMRKILAFLALCTIFVGVADGAVRDENATNRGNANDTASTLTRTASARATALRNPTARGSASSVSARTTSNTTPSVVKRGDNASVRTSRTSTTQSQSTPRGGANTVSRSATTATTRNGTHSTTTGARAGASSVISRAAIDDVSDAMTSTVTGAEYEQCKSAYFNCMDQFCSLKNDDYRRCSCSNRVFELDEIRDVMQDANLQLTEFNENLDVVGMTAAQATAMKTATEGENALTSDTSASKALLQAIMNSIRGGDTSVGGKFSDLNSISIAFDTVNAFGMSDAGQVIATYNGQNLYNAVYPQCRQAVRADCTDAQLQRAITAYLMAIEQDCNTVATAIEQQQSAMKSAVRESSAMLDLARVENRREHNSDDMAACLANVEQAVLSEEVCGAGYHKCLDNGEFIDISTGAPIAGVENFYELGNLLKFADGVDAADQKLSRVNANRTFVKNFEDRVKKFAEPALDKCTEIADAVWTEYLDKAMLDIYYAQQSKVQEIKQGCFDFVSACYMNGESALTLAMAELTGDDAVILQPDKVTLSTEMCRDYINSCNMMFYDETDGKNIVTDYIENRQDTDTLTACRAVVKQCFDNFGGTGYENFYYPYSGLFTTGDALDWFTLYEYTSDGVLIKDEPISECAKQLTEIDSCSSPEMLVAAFGGFNRMPASPGVSGAENVYYFDGTSQKILYGILDEEESVIEDSAGATISAKLVDHHTPRPSGVATEIYNQIVDILTTQCMNVQGRFIELQFIKRGLYNEDALCEATFEASLEYGGGTPATRADAATLAPNLVEMYNIGENEDMCPRDYDLNVDTQSWGACLCWENGGRRSKWGKSPKCVAAMPVVLQSPTDEKPFPNDELCDTGLHTPFEASLEQPTPRLEEWCTLPTNDVNQACPMGANETTGDVCVNDGENLTNLPEGLGI